MGVKICKARWTSSTSYGPKGYEIQVEYTGSKPDCGNIIRALEKAGQKNAGQWGIQKDWEFIF